MESNESSTVGCCLFSASLKPYTGTQRSPTRKFLLSTGSSANYLKNCKLFYNTYVILFLEIKYVKLLVTRPLSFPALFM